MLNLKEKLKQKFRSFIDVCEETAREINGTYKEMTFKMWDIGKIIAEKRKEINPKYGDQFLAGICERMKSEPTPKHLGRCERFYNRYPDLPSRQSKSGLSPSHYIELANIPEPEERDKYEEIAVDEELTVTELREKIYPEEIGKPEKKTPKDWVNMILDKALEIKTWLSEPKVIPQLTIEDRSYLKETLEDLRDRLEEFIEQL
jgi:hypothetical protein